MKTEHKKENFEAASVESAPASQPAQTGRLPHQFAIGDKVVNIWTGEVNTVSKVYWQWYAGPPTSDYTTEFSEGGWNKSTNLRLAVRADQASTTQE